VQHPIHKYDDVGVYTVTLVVNNEFGCYDTTRKVLEVLPEFSFYIPNVFTPNNDGDNEGFIGQGVGVVDHEMWIFDRWGLLIYETSSIKQGNAVPWDGRANGGQNIAQEDVYVYLVKIKDIFGRNHRYIGHVSIVK
jgi:gliding motility-associated-like protein